MAKYTLVDNEGTEYPTDNATYRNRLRAQGYIEKVDAPVVEEQVTEVPADEAPVTEEPKPRTPRRRTPVDGDAAK